MSRELTINQYVNQQSIQNRLKEIVGKNIGVFTSSLVTIANSNALLSKADPATIVGAAITAAALKLPLNQSLGYAYIVPYNVSEKDANGNWTKVVKAQFQIGYKGHYQLAMRSGQFLKISYGEIYEGQLVSNNPMEGPTFDWDGKTSDNVIGYFGYFKLLNGFTESKYWSIEDIRDHGKKYSKSFDKANSEWQNNFSSMALKTVILKLLNLAPKAIDTPEQMAVIEHISKDQAIIDDNGQFQYIDNPQTAKPVTDTSKINSVAEGIIDKVSDKFDNVDAAPKEEEYQDAVEVGHVEEQTDSSALNDDETQDNGLALPSEIAKEVRYIVPAPDQRDNKDQGKIFKKLRDLAIGDVHLIKSKSEELGLDISYLGDNFDMAEYLTKVYTKDVQPIMDL